jgi:predicted permease
MNWFKQLFLRRRRLDELSAEIQVHLAEKVEELIAGGMSRRDAEHAARREFGNVTLSKENSRDVWRWISLEDLLVDIRIAARTLRRSPGFTVIAVLTLALGIGANTALFSVVDAVMLRPLPFRDPGRLVALRCVDLKDRTQGGEVAYPVFLDWQAGSHSFEAMSVWDVSNMTYTGGDQAESVPSAVISANLFSMLGVSPMIGRDFLTSEDQPIVDQLPVMLSYEFWQSHFGGDPKILGKSLTLDGQKFGVAGVMPAGFQFPIRSERVELWTTIARDRKGKNGVALQRGVSYLSMIARLKPEIPIARAETELELIQQQLNRQYPDHRPRGARVLPASEVVTGPMGPALLILLGAVAFVLLIACVNVASLLLARATVRKREFAVRVALGAKRWMIVRQLLTESLMLAIAGAALGLVVAQWITRALIAIVPQMLPRTGEIGIDLRVLGFTLSVALVTGVLFGLAPVLQLSRAEGTRSEGGRGTSAGPAGVRLRRVLIAAQLAVAFVLLAGASLLLRSFDRLLRVDPGFRADHVLTFLLEVPSERHPGAKRPEFVRGLLQSVRELPGVKSASAIFGLPLNDDQSAFTTVEVEGLPVASSELPRTAFRIVESNYFDTMGIRLLHGRSFTERDEQSGRALAIVNEAFVRENLNGQDPLGRRIRPNISFGDSNVAPMREIVGVVSDVKFRGIRDQSAAEVYAPQTPTDFIGGMTIVVRTQADPNALVPSIRSLVRSMDKEIPMRDVRTLEEYVNGSISDSRFEAALLAAFAGLALLLSAIGLYGVVAYSVAQRTRELGIRIALGADRSNISRMVMREGTVLAATGSGVGLLAAFFAVRLIRGLLYGIGAGDPPTFIGVPVLLVGVALAASCIPARRAMRVDPVVALRYE